MRSCLSKNLAYLSFQLTAAGGFGGGQFINKQMAKDSTNLLVQSFLVGP